MSYQATVFNVMIASPGDVQIERNLVRDVIHEWNAIHSDSRKMVLQPVGWETHSRPSMEDRAQGVLNKQVLSDADLLVAVFWTRLGSPTGEAPSGTVEEIERHLDAGKPAMLYFSSAPVIPDSVDAEQYQALKVFKEECKARGLIEEYNSQNDFRQRFARHLAATINDDPCFSVAIEGGSDEISAVPDRDVPTLSQEARTLLLEAANDPHGNILHMKHMGGDEVVTNGKKFIEANNPRSRAAWVGALEELASWDLIADVGYKGEIFQITREGYELVEILTA